MEFDNEIVVDVKVKNILTTENTVFSLAKDKLNKEKAKEIDSQVAEFLKKGGKIKTEKMGKLSAECFVKNEFTGKNMKGDLDVKRKVSRKKCLYATMKAKETPTAHDYIYWSDANTKKFVVIIGDYISKQFDNINQAINHKNFKKNQGLL